MARDSTTTLEPEPFSEWCPDRTTSNNHALVGERNLSRPRLLKLNPTPNWAAHWPRWNGVVSGRVASCGQGSQGPGVRRNTPLWEAWQPPGGITLEVANNPSFR